MNTKTIGTDLSLMWPNKPVLRQLKTDIDLMDTGWVKRKIQSIWWHQMGVMSTAGSQHTWVKRAFQGDLLLWIRFKHLPSPAAGCSSSWKLFLHADMWVLIGQFGAGKFKPLLNSAILIIHSRTDAIQTSSCFLLFFLKSCLLWIEVGCQELCFHIYMILPFDAL